MKSRRRRLIRSAVAAAALLVLFGCGAVEADGGIHFSEVGLPVAASRVTVSSSLSVGGGKQAIGFTELFRTGTQDNGEVYGLMKDYRGNPAVTGLGSTTPYLCSGSTFGVKGSGPDFTALLEKHGKTFMISQFECRNGGMYMAEVAQDDAGMLSPVPDTLQWIDQSGEWGGWVHCAGSVTPWNSYLGGEEYEPDARKIEGDPMSDSKYRDKVEAYWLGDYAKSSPYHNGWITEVDIEDSGQPTPGNKPKTSFVKHYAMGRFSHEVGYVMPDRRTVYLTDDGTNNILFMFVADRMGELSAGVLYAAIWNQTSAEGGGSGDLAWVNLGHANSHEIKRAIARGIQFSDMFEADADGCTPLSANGVAECLELKPGMHKLASRLESRRYAALMGATYEFRKMEGFTYNPAKRTGYLAITEVGRAMLDTVEDPEKGRNFDDRDRDGHAETGNHIRVAKADYCGAIYSLGMRKRVRDTDGRRIRSCMVAVNMNSVLASGTEGGEVSHRACAKNDKIVAQPDNISMLPGTGAIVIGEDGRHTNNMVWSYHPDTGELTRIATVPRGAEATSTFFHKVGDYHYMTLVVQHPNASADNPGGDSITGVVGPIRLEQGSDD